MKLRRTSGLHTSWTPYWLRVISKVGSDCSATSGTHPSSPRTSASERSQLEKCTGQRSAAESEPIRSSSRIPVTSMLEDTPVTREVGTRPPRPTQHSSGASSGATCPIGYTVRKWPLRVAFWVQYSHSLFSMSQSQVPLAVPEPAANILATAVRGADLERHPPAAAALAKRPCAFLVGAVVLRNIGLLREFSRLGLRSSQAAIHRVRLKHQRPDVVSATRPRSALRR